MRLRALKYPITQPYLQFVPNCVFNKLFNGPQTNHENWGQTVNFDKKLAVE